MDRPGEALVVAETRARRVPVAFDAWVHRLGPWLMFAITLAVGLSLYASFWAEPRQIWYMFDHDRSAHYEFGLNLAMDVRHADPRALLHHLDGARVWGMLHGLLLGTIQLLVGPDYRFGILPSWLAWMATAMLAFLTARRMLPAGGTAAGVLAAMLVLQSPGHRAYATDIMLESMGAAMTMMCLWRYLVAVQEPDEASGRWLGLSLTLLFLTKSNYWVLIVAGLTLGEILRQPATMRDLALDVGRFLGRRDWWIRQFRHPLTYVFLATVALAVVVVVRGGMVLHVAGVRVSLTTAHNIVHIAFAILFLRVFLWWRRDAIGDVLAARHPIVRSLALWHLWPLAVYFLLPKRLGYFLWYISHSNRERDGGFVEGARFYWDALRADYHVLDWMTLAVAVSVVFGVAMLYRGRAGAVGVGCFLAIALLATCRHPMLKNRFAHSWIAVVWVIAAVGAVQLLSMFVRPRMERISLVGIGIASFAVAVGSNWLAPGRSEEAGPRPNWPCVLDISDLYLPELADVREPTLLSNIATPFFLSWTYQEKYQRRPFATEIKNLNHAQPQADVFRAWLDKTRSGAIVMVDVAKESVYNAAVPNPLDVAACRSLLEQTPGPFALEREWILPEGVRVSVWKRIEGRVAGR